jgi:hypothetical protein
LCWQTVEQQFIPALAIASSVRHKIENENFEIMKKEFRILVIFILGLFFSNCSKETEEFTVKSYNISITLTNDLKILDVEFYSSDTLSYKMKFNYATDLIKITKTDNKDYLLSMSNYYINSIGLADSCVDSSYYNSKLSSIITSSFKYNSDRNRVSSLIVSRLILNDPAISTIELSYGIINGNLKSTTYGGVCSDFYEYTELKNKLDIISFLGDFSGKKSINLMKSSNSGCHTTPSTTPPSSEFDYTLNSNGLVMERVEFFTSSYHVTDQKPMREKRITEYEYKFE